jgi:hypothetical protein
MGFGPVDCAIMRLFCGKGGDFGFYSFVGEKRLANMITAEYNTGLKFYDRDFEVCIWHPGCYEGMSIGSLDADEKGRNLPEKC